MTMNRTYYPIGHSCQRGVAVADFILCEFFVSAAQILNLKRRVYFQMHRLDFLIRRFWLLIRRVSFLMQGI